MTSKTSTAMPLRRAWLCGFIILALATTLAIAAESSTDSKSAVLQFANGDFVSGRLADSQGAERLAWQSSAFATPFEFSLPRVNAVQFPRPEKLPQPVGDYCFELARGDVLFGSLIEVKNETVVLDSAGIGRLELDRSLLRRMFRRQGEGEVIYNGPNGLAGWTVPGNGKGWREEAGHLLTDQPGASLRRDVGLPDKARIEFELSWTRDPDFILALGVSDNAKSAANAFRFDVWEHELVAHRETDREADLAALGPLNVKAGRVHLQAFLDQSQGRLLVFSSSGQPLADLTVKDAKPKTVGGIQLINNSGNIRLERLNVSRWGGALPRSADAGQTRIHMTDGSINYGQLQSYDAAQRRFIVRSDTRELAIAEVQVQDVIFAPEEAATDGAVVDATAPHRDKPNQEATTKTLRAILLNGQRLCGDLVKVEQGRVWLQSAGIRQPFGIAVEDLASLIGLGPRAATLALPVSPETQRPPIRVGRFELPGTVLHGHLVETSKSDVGRLAWQPSQGETSSLMLPNVSARIVYRDPPPPKPQTAEPVRQARVVVQGGLIGQVQGLLGTNNGAPSRPKSKSKSGKPILHLRSGDTFPCDITAIDEQGVQFTSPSTEATFVRHDQLKALELVSDASPVQIPKPKKERLLMLPRMQRDNPPTHLIRSVDGDYLRGRLVSMDAQQLQLEIRLETKLVQRDRVARIIWLHAEEMSGTSESSAGVSSSDQPKATTVVTPQLPGMRVQSLPSDGNRLTFFVEHLEGAFLTGCSEVLGVCRADIEQIDQLLIGSTIEQAAATLAFHQWRLKAAADPLDSGGDVEGSSEGGEGQDAALVGKPAPDIELDLLDGTKFRLSDHRQKVVILDFWASWCGPCLQVMPQIDKVAHEFSDRGVELFAINLEEQSDRIRATLDRLKLKTTVALDLNGRVAEKYGATSIPQTVIIDPNGKVVRLFVGGGPRFGDQLRTALEAVLASLPEKSN